MNNNEFFKLNKDFGDTMALVKTADSKAVLVLVDRLEIEGPFFTVNNHRYPIIKFEKPPELCGVEELIEAKKHSEFFEKFIAAVVRVCEKNGIRYVQCAKTKDLKAQPYKKALGEKHIILIEYNTDS